MAEECMLNSLRNGVRIWMFLFEEWTIRRLTTILDPRLKKKAFHIDGAVSILHNELIMHTSLITHGQLETDNVLDTGGNGSACGNDYIAVPQFSFMKKRLKEEEYTVQVTVSWKA